MLKNKEMKNTLWYVHIYTYTISWYKAGKTRVLELNIPFWKLKKKIY